jgi:hypothetical protein
MRQILDGGFDPKFLMQKIKLLECKECGRDWRDTPELRKCPINPSHGDGIPKIVQIDPIETFLSLQPRRIERRLRRGARNELKHWIRTLQQADTIVSHMSRFLYLIDEKDLSKTRAVIQETAHALIDLSTAPGRSEETLLGYCANELGNMFKNSDYRKYHWDWVGQVLEERFPDALPKDPKGKRDLAEWAKDLAKRYRKLQKNQARCELAEFRNSRWRLRKHLNAGSPPKTLATILPYLLQSEGRKFWPHEVPSHDPKSCSMCNDRRGKRSGSEHG